MAALFHSTTFVVLAVLISICSLHTDYADAACPSGFQNCGRNHHNRCLTNIKTDPNNCGNCGVTCPTRAHSTPTCTNRVCNIRCKSGYANCDKKNPNGCEIATSRNPNHCGKCNRKCPTHPNTIPTCTNNHCTPKCKPGWADCNKDMLKDGCETFIAGSDPLNCGKCGSLCKEDQYPHGVYKCNAGKCGLFWCHTAMEDCNGVLEDGCEENTFSNPMACGSCNNVCPTYPYVNSLCANRRCRFVCEEGFDYCYGSEIDERGCEKYNFDIDAENCGGCNIQCPIGQSCQEGICKLE